MNNTIQKSIGHYSFPVMGGRNQSDIEYAWKPFFAIRDIPSDIDLDSGIFKQIKIHYLGSLVWINVRIYDLIF